MIVTIVTFSLPQQTTLAEITKTFQGTAPKYRGMPGLLRKNYFLSEDGRRAGGIYVWGSRADADRVYCYAANLGWDAAAALAPLGAKAAIEDDLDALVANIVRDARPGDHVLVMSNGAFGGIHGKLLAALKSAA